MTAPINSLFQENPETSTGWPSEGQGSTAVYDHLAAKRPVLIVYSP